MTTVLQLHNVGNNFSVLKAEGYIVNKINTLLKCIVVPDEMVDENCYMDSSNCSHLWSSYVISDSIYCAPVRTSCVLHYLYGSYFVNP